MAAKNPGWTAAERRLRERIQAEGRQTFAAFMGLVLYDAEVGYYSRPASPLGARGDYYTSPELHPAFAGLIARQVQDLWQALGAPRPFVIHEAGPGTGLFARDLLDRLRLTAPDLYASIEYRLDEVSPTLRRYQADVLTCASHAGRANWVRGFEDGPTVHLVVANELLDALPVHLVETQGDELVELYVDRVGDRLALTPGPLSTARLAEYFAALDLELAEGNRAEVGLAALDWVASAAKSIHQGLLLLLDYGYPAEVLFAPSRRHGTLLCYYRHTLTSDPLVRVGEQDITTHIDFTSVRRAGEEAGLSTLGLVSQRRLLTNLGWNELRRELDHVPIGQVERDANQRALEGLIDPEGLGRVLALFQQRGLDDYAPIGLVGGPAVGWCDVPLRAPEHLLLPHPAEADYSGDFESQWSELFGDGENDA